MVATVQIISYHGATGSTETQIDGSVVKYKRADNDTDDTLNPVVIPLSGTNYSWRKSFKLKITVSPDGDISNLRFFTAGSWGTGITLYGLKQATYTQGSSTDETALFDAGAVDTSTWTSSSPYVINSGIVISNPNTGTGTQDYLVTQLAVDSTATRGTAGPVTLTYRFDET